jgi:hypothetical protein
VPTLSLKVYTDIAAGVVVLLFLAWVFHEGEKRIESADARVVAAQVIHNEEVNQRAQSAIQAAEDRFRTLYAIPPIAPIHVSVCNAPGPGPIRDDAPATERGDGTPAVSQAVGPVRDIGPATDKLLEQADAQIELLQAYINECVKQGICRAR